MAKPKAQQAALESELFRLLVENSEDYAIFVIDDQRVVLSWNRGAERVLGYRDDEVVGRTSFLLFTPEDRAQGIPERELATALQVGRADDDRWHLRKDGTRLWVNGVLIRLTDERGKFRGFAKVMRDFTERKRMQDAIQESEERLRIALPAAEMGTWLWRIPTDEQVLDGNLLRLLGLSPDLKILKSDDFLRSLHMDDRQAVANAFNRCRHEGGSFTIEFRAVRPDGSTRWLRNQGKSFADPEGKPLFLAGACVDVTADRQYEEALKRADRRKDEFLAMLAHELRNPLAPIRTGLYLLTAAPNDAAILSRTRDMIQRQVDHLIRLVDDLLDVSRIRRGNIEVRRDPLNLHDVIARSVETNRHVLDSRRQKLILNSNQTCFVRGDSVRLTQVIGNLLNNASKYTPRGGVVTISLSEERGHAVVEVRDTGAGIPAEMLSQVFELFTQVDHTIDRSKGGLGIGLTLVKTLVEMHGGSVEALSDGPGHGSVFRVRLPLMSAAPAASSSPSPSPVASAGRRVVVVDDNVDAAESLADVLRTLGHSVRTSHQSIGVAKLIQEFGPDVVILDIGLPGMSGYQVARQIRQQIGNDVTIIAVSGYGQEDDLKLSREAGFDHHLVKPADLVDLQRIIDRTAKPLE